MLLYIIRHGEPIYDPDTLTPLGKEQAEALGKRLALHGFDKIYSSPNGRARETAEPTCNALGKEAEILSWASEDLLWRDLKAPNVGWAFNGDARTIKTPELTASDSRWYESEAFSEAKAPKEGFDRAKDGIDGLLLRHGYERDGLFYNIIKPSSERVALFCHQGVGLTALSHVLGIPPCLFWTSFDVTHTGVSIVHFEDRGMGYVAPKCLALSDTAHIYGSSLPYRYCGHNEEEVLL